jgi:C1A family cysteine protease
MSWKMPVHFQNPPIKKRKEYKMAKSTKTEDQVIRICNIVPSRNTERDWTFDDAVSAGLVEVPVSIPASVDLRAAWWNIGNQENTGSCVGWASTDGLMRYLMVKAGKLAQATRLSPRMTWMAAKETDEFTNRPTTFIEGGGTSLKAAMEILRKYGSVPETMLPFHISTLMYTGNENSFFLTASQRRISSYLNLYRNFAQWRTWLSTNRPILVALNVDATFDNAANTQGKLDVFKPNTVRGGHAVCLVGYTADGRFIIRNSWGTGWGVNGFGFASEAYINGAFYNESYVGLV